MIAGLPTKSLVDRRPPRCPPYVEANSSKDLLPYLEAVARRPYNTGLHAGWDLHPGDRVSLRVDNWHDPMCVEAIVTILEKFGCKYEVVKRDRGPIPSYHGYDEVDYYFMRTKELADWIESWEEADRKGEWDKILQGYGGPILSERRVKIQRVPFVTPEMVASRAHTLPYEILEAIDLLTWSKILQARRIHITDPEGTDLTFTHHDAYYEDTHHFYSDDLVAQSFPQNRAYARTYLPGHIWGRPLYFLPSGEDGTGVIAGTMNHIGPFPHMRMHVEGSAIVSIEEGGRFGENLRKVMVDTQDVQYPGMPGKGLLWWWEASIGTNPKIHRPRKNYLQGLNCGLFERMRSGIVHIGYGTVISSAHELQAARDGKKVGHFHVHLNFATFELETRDGRRELLIDDGHLTTLDDPAIRAVAAKYGDPDDLLSEDWIPAVPGINMDGDYNRDYAGDPEDWTLTELHVCQRWHNMYMKMISPDPNGGHHHHHPS